MKSIRHEVALSTVLGVVDGFANVIIENRTEKSRYIDNAQDTLRWKGHAKDVWKAGDEVRYKWMNSKVHEIRPLSDGKLMLVIITENEKY